jgi:hypothetical protein
MTEIHVAAQGDLSHTGDIVGRDKITNICQSAPTASASTPGSAPPPPSLLIGREEVLRDLEAKLNLAGDHAHAPIQILTTIQGWPGVGKAVAARARGAGTRPAIRRVPARRKWTSGSPSRALSSAQTKMRWG